MMVGPIPSRSRRPGGPSARGLPAAANANAVRETSTSGRTSMHGERTIAGISRGSGASTFRRPQNDDPVRAAQEEATRVWRADMRRLLERAEERFADICWTTASPSTPNQAGFYSELGHTTFASPTSSDEPHFRNASQEPHDSMIPISRATPPPPSIPDSSAFSSGQLIWAHKAILYARAPNTFQTRFLNLRPPAAQLQHIGSTASLVSLPLHRSESQLSLSSSFSSSTQTGAPTTATAGSSNNSLSSRPGIPAKPRKSIRGAAPPSSFSMTKPSLRKPISRSSISRPLRRPSVDDASSYASGYMTSDSEGEGGPSASLRASRLINARSTPTPTGQASLTSPSKVSQISSSAHGSSAPLRKPSFGSVTSAAESRLTAVSDASTIHAPMSLGGVSQAFFEATLQYLYTGEEAMVDAFEFLFEDRLASDSEATPEEKLDKLRSDLTFMWRSKLYSDVRLVLGEDDGSDDAGSLDVGRGKKGSGMATKMVDIPDANMSVLSLAQTIDTEKVDDSDAEDDELTSFSTHRMILASRSQYFASMLLSPYADAKAPVLHLPSPPFTPASLHFTLGFLYTGTLFFSNRTFDLSTAFSLWRAGAYLQIETLQALVVALIDREFCHGFTCSPPCRKCVKRVPRTLAFATSSDVSEPALQDPAIAAVSGPHFGMYWAKEVGNLDPMMQDRIVDSITASLQPNPDLVVSVLRQLSIVGQRIDTERSSRWVESLRLMAETVENRLMPLLHSNLETIVTSQAWSDLLDGVGSLGDVLEKSLVMLVDGLTEARAAQIYQVLVGQVLLREQGFEVSQSRQAVENARASILRYLKKRWINVRALGGFNKLEKWCLKEIADELDVSTADLILVEQEAPRKAGGPPSRLLSKAPIAERRTSSVAGGASQAASTPMQGSRVRMGSPASSQGTSTPSPTSSRRVVKADDGEREAGPIHMRAAVLNRNAARTSVANGHRSLSSASTASASSPTTVRPAASTATTRTVASPTSTAARTPAPAASPRVAAADGSASRSATPSKAPAPVAAKQRLRTESGASVASVASTRTMNGRMPSNPTTRPSTGSIAKSPRASTSTSDPIAQKTSQVTDTDTTASAAATPKRSTTQLPTVDADKTPTKSIRTVRSAATLTAKSPSTLSDAKPPSAITPSPASTISATTKNAASTSLDSATTKKQPSLPPPPPSLAKKSSFLRATPGPGGTFSLSSTDSGHGLRARTLSSTSSRSKGSAGEASADSITPATRARAVEEALPEGAVENVRKARESVSGGGSLAKSDSARTIIDHDADGEDMTSNAGAMGIRLNVGIPCIVSLNVSSRSSTSSAPAARTTAQRKTSSSSSSFPSTARSATTTAGSAKKFRATVFYLGPVTSLQGVWVGVRLNLPPTLANAFPITSPASHSAKTPIRLKGGCLNCVRYLPPAKSSRPQAQKEFTMEDGREEAEHRVERRRELWLRVAPEQPFPVRPSQGGRRGDAGKEEGGGVVAKKTPAAATTMAVDLLVRPWDIVWVVQ